MLDITLLEYADSGIYPFHMPGHKRHSMLAASPYRMDITEIDGFDNLHAPQGILKEAQMRAAALYGAERSYYLVNGSTCGNLAAISAAVKPGGRLLMARGAHKSVYHAVCLRGISTVYLQPQMTEFGILGAVDAQEVARALLEEENIDAVLLTSPTYEGVVSDIASIADVVHAHGIPLLVDEAHGAHFGLHPAFPETAARLGADVVVQSMHKVLPSLTQTALLHLCSARVERKQIERYLGMYQTSSPSYVLMAGMERCIRFLREEGEARFSRYRNRLMEFYEKAEGLSGLHVMRREDFTAEEIYDLDLSKIVISVKNTNISGETLYRKLLKTYRLQMEMASGAFALGMTSIMDTQEGFDRLCEALWEIDGSLSHAACDNDANDLLRRLYRPKKKAYEPAEAFHLPAEEVSFDAAVGRASADMAYLYPPGAPMLLPGEIIDADVIKNMRSCKKMQLNLQGIADITNERVNVVKSQIL